MRNFYQFLRNAMRPSRSIPQTAWTASHPWQLSVTRVFILYFGLLLLGVGGALVVQSGLGNAPWTVFAQGISIQSGISLGWSFFLVSCAVLLIWIPLKLKPGFGTLSNALIFAITLQTTLNLISPPDEFLLALAAVFVGIVLVGAGTAIYVTCGLGGGPRDGLMIGLVENTQWRVAYIRSGIEGSVLVLGFLLGGQVGLGTVLSVFLAGWSVSVWLNIVGKLAPPSGKEFFQPEF
jgi:uncharacterized membrane protein YczE